MRAWLWSTLVALVTTGTAFAETPGKIIAVAGVQSVGNQAEAANKVWSVIQRESESGARDFRFTVVPRTEIDALRTELGACNRGQCDMQIARRTNALVLITGETVEEDGKWSVSLRMLDAEDGVQLTSSHCVAAAGDVEKCASDATRALLKDLKEMDAEASAEARDLVEKVMPTPTDAELPAPPAPPVKIESLPQPPAPIPLWKSAGAIAGTIVPLVAALTLLSVVTTPLIIVPVIGFIPIGLWLLHPFAVAAAGWYVGVKVLGKRIPLLPSVLAGGLAQLAFLPCFVVLTVFPGPLVSIGALAAVNATVTAIALHRMGRPLSSGEAPINFDWFSVPDVLTPPPESSVDEFPEPLSKQPTARIVEGKPYKLRPRKRAEPVAKTPEKAPEPVVEDTEEDVIPSSGQPDQDAITSVVRESMAAINACYEQRLKRNSTLRGRIVVAFTIGTDGKVTDAQLQSDGVEDPEVGKCVVLRFKHLTFAPQKDGPVDATFPIVFVPERE